MADFAFVERKKIEKFLGMGSGYVLNFSNRTFQEFIAETVSLDIDDPKYNYGSNSKANRLRQFFKSESSYTIGKLLSAFCDYWLSAVQTQEITLNTEDEVLYKECLLIAERLKQEIVVEHIDAIKPNADDRDFKLLAKSIKESIEKHEPEAALDRLHTFTVKYIRELCDKHAIAYGKNESLNAIFGKYVKFLIGNGHIQSTMSEKILKYSISVIEAFNDVRNNSSFAHDNQVLNYHESILIVSSVSSTIKFIDSIESRIKNNSTIVEEIEYDLPF